MVGGGEDRRPALTNAPMTAPHRNGSRTGLLSTKAGNAELAIPKARHGSFLPALLEPRRAHRPGPVGGDQWRPSCTGCSPARSTTSSSLWASPPGCPKSQVPRICAELDGAVWDFRERRLDHIDFTYLVASGIVRTFIGQTARLQTSGRCSSRPLVWLRETHQGPPTVRPHGSTPSRTSAAGTDTTPAGEVGALFRRQVTALRCSAVTAEFAQRLAEAWAAGSVAQRSELAFRLTGELWTESEKGSHAWVARLAPQLRRQPGFDQIQGADLLDAELRALEIMGVRELGLDTLESLVRQMIDHYANSTKTDIVRRVVFSRYLLGEYLDHHDRPAEAAMEWSTLLATIGPALQDPECAMYARMAAAARTGAVLRSGASSVDATLSEVASSGAWLDVTALRDDPPQVKTLELLALFRVVEAMIALERVKEAAAIVAQVLDAFPDDGDGPRAVLNLISNNAETLSCPPHVDTSPTQASQQVHEITQAVVDSFAAGALRSAAAGIPMARTAVERLQSARSQQLSDDSAARLLIAKRAIAGAPMVLYLRGFASEATTTPVFTDGEGKEQQGHIIGNPSADLFEGALVAATGPDVVVAISNPAWSLPDSPGGAHRLLVAHRHWEHVVRALTSLADSVVVDASSLTPGLATELDLIAGTGAAARTLVLAPSEWEPDFFRGVIAMAYGSIFPSVSAEVIEARLRTMPKVIRYSTDRSAVQAELQQLGTATRKIAQLPWPSRMERIREDDDECTALALALALSVGDNRQPDGFTPPSVRALLKWEVARRWFPR